MLNSQSLAKLTPWDWAQHYADKANQEVLSMLVVTSRLDGWDQDTIDVWLKRFAHAVGPVNQSVVLTEWKGTLTWT